MKYFNAEEKELLFKQIYREEGRHRKRNIAIFEVAKYCALRASEISNLKLGFYDRSSSTLYCQRLKGSNSNTLMIVDPYVRKALNDYLDELDSAGYEGDIALEIMNSRYDAEPEKAIKQALDFFDRHMSRQ